MTNVYAVVGQHRQEQNRFLLLGDDGRFYASASPAAEPVPIDMSIAGSLTEWVVETESVPASVMRAINEHRADRPAGRLLDGVSRILGIRYSPSGLSRS